MGSIVRGLERGLALVFVIVFSAVFVVLKSGNGTTLDELVAYAGLFGISFILYRLCFRVPLQKLRLLNEMIRLGVHSIEDVKNKTGAVKIDNEHLRKNRHYRIQVTNRIIANLKNLKWCGKKIGRVAASYAALHIDHPVVLMDIILAMRDNEIIAEVFRRKLFQLAPLDSEWFCRYFGESLKNREPFPFDDEKRLLSLCEKIYKVCVSYNNEESIRITMCVAINYLLDQHPQPETLFGELKIKVKSTINKLLSEKSISQEVYDNVFLCFA
jgi:hypothetical protein